MSANNKEIDTNFNNNSDTSFTLLQETIIFQNKIHYLKMKDLQQKELCNTIYDDDYKYCLKLLNIFIKHNIPLNKKCMETME